TKWTSSVLKKNAFSLFAGGADTVRRSRYSTSTTVNQGCFKTSPMAYGANASIHRNCDGKETVQRYPTLLMRLESEASWFSRTELWFLRRRSRIDGTLYLHSWSLLSTSARERLAGIRRVAGFRISFSRLERTHNGGVLCPEWNGTHSGWLPQHRKDHEQLREYQ